MSIPDGLVVGVDKTGIHKRMTTLVLQEDFRVRLGVERVVGVVDDFVSTKRRVVSDAALLEHDGDV